MKMFMQNYRNKGNFVSELKVGNSKKKKTFDNFIERYLLMVEKQLHETS